MRNYGTIYSWSGCINNVNYFICYFHILVFSGLCYSHEFHRPNGDLYHSIISSPEHYHSYYLCDSVHTDATQDDLSDWIHSAWWVECNLYSKSQIDQLLTFPTDVLDISFLRWWAKKSHLHNNNILGTILLLLLCWDGVLCPLIPGHPGTLTLHTCNGISLGYWESWTTQYWLRRANYW